ncbi:hypothetical protein CRYUN_Cryun05aG0032500 [Craigia yunnanensis]
MAEAIVSTILEQLTAITIEKASEAWRLVRGVEKEVKRLESNFKAIQYELEDAEEKQYLDKRVEHWLERFKQVCYDIEDVLDDWKTADVEISSSCVPKWKVCPSVSCFPFGSQVLRRDDIATRIKDINKELDQIVKDKDKFELIRREIIKQPKRPESTSFVDVSKLHGRDRVKEDIIRRLLCETSKEEGSCISTMAIVGMAGIGKTSLGQLIYNDGLIQTHFDKNIWVCVSDPFDLGQIARAILENLDSTISFQNTTPLQNLLSKIRENIKEKKFFLVLDDVWTDHGQDWEQLKAAFQSAILGSKILVTTRKESVAKHMGSYPLFPLDLLSEEVCWLILAQKAFTGRSKDSRENLEDIGREIAKKCKGLPLAANTLGGLLQDKLRREEWQNVLNSEIWKLDFAQEDIFTPLLLSYYDLPSAIRRCLLYCAIFPKDYKIDKDKLVRHWMAQGYLNDDNNLETELKGEDYFKCMATRSFFQDFYKDADGNICSCKMHDMVHDFVQFLTKREFVMEKKILSVENVKLDLSSKKVRHLRLVIENWSFSPMSIYGTEKLRSLVAVSNGYNVTASEALQNLLSRSKHLRLLEFDSFDLDAEEIARDIGKLVHLRYLSLISCFGMINLPEAVCELPNLQYLNLHKCRRLEKLPVGIGKLIHLRYLSLISCSEIKNLPEAVCELYNLQSLNLQNCLTLQKLPDGIGKLIHLRYLSLISCSEIKNLPEAVCELYNLQSLNLQNCLTLQKLPDGIGKLINLRYLCTEGCRDLTCYPKGISNLTSLMRLSNIKMRADRNGADQCSIGDLENLDLLGGNLRVELIGNAIDWDEAKKAKLHKKMHLKRLDIWICSPHIKEEEVVQALNPPSNLSVELFDYLRWSTFRKMRFARTSSI